MVNRRVEDMTFEEFCEFAFGFDFEMDMAYIEESIKDDSSANIDIAVGDDGKFHVTDIRKTPKRKPKSSSLSKSGATQSEQRKTRNDN